MRRVALLLGLTLSVLTRTGNADPPPTPKGDSVPPPQIGPLVTVPLRLGLTADSYLAPRDLCADHLPENGGVLLGWRATTVSLTPRLTLFGFSGGTCSLDSHVGGGAVYEVPLTSRLSFVGSVGALFAPQALQSKKTSWMPRGDLLWKRDSGRHLAFGLSPRGFSVSGLW